jgi:hypothetical protein
MDFIARKPISLRKSCWIKKAGVMNTNEEAQKITFDADFNRFWLYLLPS